VFAGVVRTPMTSVLMIFELTQDYAVIVPLMIANLVSLFVASQLQHEPIYEALAVQDGIHMPTRPYLGQHRAATVMKSPDQFERQMLPAETTVRDALERIRSNGLKTALVTDQRGVIGVIDRDRLEQEASQGAEKNLGELANEPVFPHIHPDQGLDLALERMGTNRLEMRPVVSRADVHQLLGVVTLPDVLQAYGVGQA
jgi:CIC family chloride channel protein